MKIGGIGPHAFGEAVWWGKDLFGIDNALVGDWPVVAIVDGRAASRSSAPSSTGGASTGRSSSGTCVPWS